MTKVLWTNSHYSKATTQVPNTTPCFQFRERETPIIHRHFFRRTHWITLLGWPPVEGKLITSLEMLLEMMTRVPWRWPRRDSRKCCHSQVRAGWHHKRQITLSDVTITEEKPPRELVITIYSNREAWMLWIPTSHGQLPVVCPHLRR